MSAAGKNVFCFSAAVACAALAGCGGSSGSAAPRIVPIPLQQIEGTGTMFALDVEPFVIDQTPPLTYSVVSGGGSFAGSTYSNMFDTLGAYQVTFQVADPVKTTTDTFEVEVQTANLAVVRVDGRSLSLLDTDTDKLVLASAASNTETFMAGLTRGHLVFERFDGSSFDLFAFDLAKRQTWTLGDSRTLDERFETVTSAGHVVFTSGDAADTDLFLWNSATGLAKPISESGNEHDLNALVSGDLVFYERTTGGQADIWVYDPATDESTAVSTHPNSESLVAALPNGAVVFSRIGGSGETDLFRFQVGNGIVEIGGDLGPAAASLSKTFHASSTGSQVVFSVTGSPTSKSLYYWTNGTTLAIDSDEDLAFRGISADDVVAYTIETGGQDDVYCFDVVNDTPGNATAVSTDAADETVEAVVSKSGSSYVVYTRDSAPDSLHVYDVATPGTTGLTDAAGVEFRAALTGGDLVYRLGDGSEVFHFDPATATSTSTTSGLAGTAMDFAGAGSEAGDFVLTVTVSAQTDLYLWDHSATSRVTVSDTVGDDVFQVMTSTGRVLFTRVVTGNANADLFVFDPSSSMETRLTAVDTAGLLHDHEVVGSYSADRR